MVSHAKNLGGVVLSADRQGETGHCTPKPGIFALVALLLCWLNRLATESPSEGRGRVASLANALQADRLPSPGTDRVDGGRVDVGGSACVQGALLTYNQRPGSN